MAFLLYGTAGANKKSLFIQAVPAAARLGLVLMTWRQGRSTIGAIGGLRISGVA